MSTRSSLCERARSWASLRADGELSELESALLDAHLERCGSCRTYARRVEGLTQALRSVRTERPARPLFDAPRTRGHARRVQLIAATIVVVAAGALAASSTPPHPERQAGKPVAMVAAVDDPDRLRELRRPGLIDRGRSSALLRLRRLMAEPV